VTYNREEEASLMWRLLGLYKCESDVNLRVKSSSVGEDVGSREINTRLMSPDEEKKGSVSDSEMKRENWSKPPQRGKKKGRAPRSGLRDGRSEMD
jgi:hypothetical protein